MAEQREPPLLPCPFCGGEPDPREWASNKAPGDPVFYGPGCSKCGATAQSPEEWNRRILPPSAAPSQFEAEPGQPSNPAVAGFTPGPWKAVGLMVKAGHETVVHVGASNSFRPPRPQECAENARLIAAGPGMHAALEYAASTLENEYRSDPTLQDLARSLRAALELKEETGNGGH